MRRGTRSPSCPCCNAPAAAAPLESIPYRRIWDSLSEQWGASFSDDVRRRHTPCAETLLFECGSCGTQYFVPPVPGDADFYRELGESPLYYSSWKWEFGWVGARLPRNAAVLDVGCGNGEFLAGISTMAQRAVGVEWSSTAVARARARGVDARQGDLSMHARDFEGMFDAVCAFHILEHLPAPVTFVGMLLRCLRPGGSLFLSVPNRMRSGRALMEPLDCPPHHLTRWSVSSLEALVRRVGMIPADFGLEPVEPSVPCERLRERVRHAVEKVPLAGGILGKWLPRAAWRIVFFSPFLTMYRRYGLLERAGFFGLSLAARCVRAPT